MAFITDNTGTIGFAEYDDLILRDQRVFEANTGIDVPDDVEDGLIRSTNRIVTLLSKALGITVDINSIIDRQDDFTDICVYHTLYDLLYPKIADFGNEDNAERQKIDFYQGKFNDLLGELIEDGDWYDSSGDSVVNDTATVVERRRVR